MTSKTSSVAQTKALILNTRNDSARIARIKSQAEAVARAPSVVHPAARHLVPTEYAPGALGWTTPVDVREERDASGEPTGRVAVISEETFSRGKPDFDGAGDQLPGDWISSRPVGVGGGKS